jgi:putative FmdB family regulatory protein
MPIYEYEAAAPRNACVKCRQGFEALQSLSEDPLSRCPACGAEVKRIISWCRSAIMDRSEESVRVERRIREYEKSGMWSHAAELADKHSERVNDKDLKTRALENYKKAGYNADSLAKHGKTNDK